MITHYIPYFCRENGRQREAVCGHWVTPPEHSAEPTCADCARWLLQEADETKTADGAFAPDSRDGNTEDHEPMKCFLPYLR